jgi:ribonuclease BN (tRNA processing enzyme)
MAKSIRPRREQTGSAGAAVGAAARLRSLAWPGRLTIVALSHLRWDFVYQRPQHLLTRAARQHRVLYVEKPKRDTDVPFMEVRTDASDVSILVPHLAASSTDSDLRLLLDQQLAHESLENLVLWYYTPMALAFSDHCALVRSSTTAWTS